MIVNTRLRRSTAQVFFRLICILLSMAASDAGVSTPCPLEKYINEDLIRSIVQARESRSLKERWAHAPVKDLVSRAFYYTRLMELAPGKEAELGILETLPSSQIEFDFLYSVNDTKTWQAEPAVSRVYAAYFDHTPRAVVKHPEYIARFLMMSRFADGEAKNLTDQANDSLRQLNPDVYMNGLRLLDAESRRCVCGDCPELKQKGGA